MYDLKNDHAEFSFDNGYKIRIKINRSVVNSDSFMRQNLISCNTADVSIYLGDTDVTQDFLDNGILKYKERVTTSIFFKVANIIKTLPSKKKNII